MNAWRTPEERDYNQRIFREELNDFVPAKIFDTHVHITPTDGFLPGAPFSCGGVPITSYTYEELAADLEVAFPRRQVEALCFGYPDPKLNHERNNACVGGSADFNRFFPLRLLDPRRDNAALVNTDIYRYGFLGFKPYPDYARPDDIPNAEIPEMLPDWAMAIAHERRLLVMLHIPRSKRLEDPLNRRQLRELCVRWPGAKIILAHIGRAYYLRGITGFLDDLRELPNLYFDLAMVQHWEVIAHLFCQVPISKVLYGSDIPIALAQGKAVEINHQYTYITPRPWSLSLCDEKKKLQFTSFLNEQLRAIQQAATAAKLPRPAITALFYDNARALVGEVAARIKPAGR
ncbi:MAG: amidohydrolase family protein [Verrucomicrobiia bacterium]